MPACVSAQSPRCPADQLSRSWTWRAARARLFVPSAPTCRCANRGACSTTTSACWRACLEAALDGPVDLVTTSALLDLVSADWLERLVTEVAARRLPLYASLSYDGRVAFAPADPRDAAVIAAVNSHQRRDKGFGPALGPVAAQTASVHLEKVGYDVALGESDWLMREADLAMQEALLAGWAVAASETAEMPAEAVAEWLVNRRANLMANRSRIRVGHVDLFAAPAGARRADRSQSNSTSSPSR